MAFVAASLGFRFISYVSEAAALYEALQQIEFDGWHGDLYDKEVGRNSPGIYIHYSPRITLGVIGASILSLPLLLTRHVEMDGEVVYVLLLVLAEAGQLVLQWILELFAHFPAKITLQWWIATYGTTHG